MSLGQRLIPIGCDFDTSPVYIKSDRAYFMKGIDTGWQATPGGQGQNAVVLKPAQSNTLYCSVALPVGENKVIGYFYYAESNEGYVVVYNSNGNHLIYRLRGIDGTCQVVYNFCNSFRGITAAARDYFSEGRIAMKAICRYLPDGSKELYKELYLVNKKVDNLRIVVEDSIATNSFSTPFFFTNSDPCCGDRCRIIKSGVPTPMARINVIPIPPTAADALKQNTMLFKMFQFRFVDENAWGQRSEHGLISEQYFNNLAGCSRDAAAQPHCVWLQSKVPCPEIVRRTVEVRSCELKMGGIGTDGNLLSEWKEALHIDLYDQTDSTLKWYQRKYDTANTEFEFLPNGKMRIRFCNNRECKPVALADIRNSNPSPINSGTVCGVGKALAYGDNENNLGPFLKSDLDSISHTLEPTEACEQKYSRIKIYAVVHNWNDNQNNPIYMRNGKVTFGGYGQDPAIGPIRLEEKVEQPETTLSAKGGHGQIFPEGIKGFRASLAGTNFNAESVQYTYSASGLEKIGVLQSGADSYVKEVGWGRHWAIQEFDFGMVPLGRYIFRIHGHNDTENLANTSTYYIHTTTFASYNQHWAITQNYQKEIFIDTTAGNDFMSFGPAAPLAVIADLTKPSNTFSIGSRAMRGYVYEDRDNKIPVELLDVRTNNGMPTGGVSSGGTDHNGFWFTSEWTSGSAFSSLSYKAQLFGPRKCVFDQMVAQTGNKSAEGTTLIEPVYLSDKFPTFVTDACNRYVVTGKLSECGTGGGIEGVAVILGRTKPVFTNSRGEFKVIAHYASGRGSDNMILSLGGGCFVLDCNCQPVNVIFGVTQPLCVSCVETNIIAGNFNMRTIVTHGGPHGGRIQIGFTGEDWVGRMTDIQTMEKFFVDLPSEQEQGNGTYPRLMIHLPANFSADLCRRFARITPWFSKNTNYDDFFEWAADDVWMVDSAGNKNDISPTKIKIWYRSLNGYNLFRGLNTNTTWNFFDTAGNSRVGDIVEFIQDADGKYFPPHLQGSVQYDQQGTYFLVDYDDSLKGLKAGVKFKIMRPYFCEINKTFREVGFPINLCADCVPRDDDGNQITSFELNITSSYMLPRQIPVVTDVVTLVDSTSGSGVSAIKNIIMTPIVNKLLGWNQDTSYTVTTPVTTEVKTMKVYPYRFEHHSPSDTWGDHCNNGGRVSFINPYEGKKCDRTQVMITGGLNQANDGAVNYLHWFSLTDEFVIDEQGWGGITAMLARDDGQILLICEYTCYTFRTQDDRAVVDEKTGFVRLPIKSVFGSPDQNKPFSFGCQLPDVNTIRKADALVTFLDSHKQAMVLHDFTQAIDVSSGIQSWLVPAIKKVIASGGTMFWHSCFDLRKNRVILTKFDSAAPLYANDEVTQRIDLPESMAFNYETKLWQPVHFTPEYFGGMNGDPKESQFFSFRNGLPWAHHNSVNPSSVYLNYFGIQCQPVIGVVTNEGGTDTKGFLASDVHCSEILFILEDLETSMGQRSQVYSGGWEWGEGVWSAGYNCDTQNPDACNPVQDPLFDGDCLFGHWLKALYIPDPEYKGEYFTLTSITSYFFDRVKGG